MRILFISRAFPPITGGIENQNAALSEWLPKHATVRTLANHGGKTALPWFLPWVLIRSLFLLPRYDVVLLGDGVLAIVGFIIKFFFSKKTVVSIVHGLDLTYPNTFYQKYWLGKFLPALDGLIAVSRETKEQAKEKGIPEEKIAVIGNGIETETLLTAHTRTDLEKLLGISLTEKKVLLTAGRLVKRKGVAWFIRFVFQTLPENTLYVIAGSGPEEQAIREACTEKNLGSRVFLLGRVPPETLKILLNTVDIFVQPNIRVSGDMEGFGIAVIEAAACGRVVVASELEGLRDAIVNNENGLLVESENAEAFRLVITVLLQDDQQCDDLAKRAQVYTREHFHWSVISKQYIETLETFMKK